VVLKLVVEKLVWSPVIIKVYNFGLFHKGILGLNCVEIGDGKTSLVPCLLLRCIILAYFKREFWVRIVLKLVVEKLVWSPVIIKVYNFGLYPKGILGSNFVEIGGKN